MSHVIDTFTPAKFLPVHITHDGMEQLETELETQKNNDTLFVEIGEDIDSTPAHIIEVLQSSFSGILEQAIEEDCEYISFYI